MVQAGTLFEYLVAFVTIVLALALGDLATSLHRLIRARRTVRWHPLPLAAAFMVLLVLLTSFFGLWSLAGLTRVTYIQLLWFVLPQVCYFLAASAVLPDEVTPDFDLVEFYLDERRYLYAVLMLGLLFEFIDDLLGKQMPSSLRGAALYFGLNTVMLAAFAAMWVSRRRWVHWTGFATLFVGALFGFIGWEARGGSAIEPVVTLPVAGSVGH